MKTPEESVNEYLDSFGLKTSEREWVKNAILAYMTDCIAKDEIIAQQEKALAEKHSEIAALKRELTILRKI